MSEMNKQDNKDDKKKSFFNDLNKSNLNNPSNPQMKFMRNLVIWLLLTGAAVIIWMFMNTETKPEYPISYSEYQNLVEESRILKATIYKSQLNDFEFKGELKSPIHKRIDGRDREVRYFVTKLGVVDSKTEEWWQSKGITWTYEAAENPWWGAVLSILPWILLIGV